MYNEGFFPAGKLNPVFYRSWTPEKPRMMLIYVHGSGGCTSADGIPLAQALSGEAGIRVIAFDAPGHGYSQVNAGFSSVEVQRIVMEKLVNNAKTPVALLASSGGAIATLKCLDSHRNNPEFKRIPMIFSEPSLRIDEETQNYLELIAQFLSGRFASLDDARRVWDQTPLSTILFDNEDAKTAYIRGMLQVQGNAFVALTRAKDTNLIKPFNLLTGKEPLENPTLVLWGEKGGVKERIGQQLDSLLINQTTIEFPGAGHPLSLTRKVEVEAVAQFLRHHAGV